MGYIADLHIHSRFSRATAPDLSIPLLDAFGRRKGVRVLGTGDCIHPAWMQELRTHLVEAGDGLYRAAPGLSCGVSVPGACEAEPRFVLQTEISCIYRYGDRVRKVHHVILLPRFDAAERLAARLGRVGNIHSDGRPILGLDSRDLLEIVLETSPEAILIPAHIWTPWFSVLGSRSGFESVRECFRDLEPHIHAVETGLSSDPPMNWRVRSLDRYRLISNSDAHSPSRIGREANLLEGEPSWEGLHAAVVRGDGLSGTLEFHPEEGKYHLDGHRTCGVRLDPEETMACPGLRCPSCGRPVTVGVLHRVSRLADRSLGEKAPEARPFESLVGLDQALGEVLGRAPASRTVQGALEGLLAALGPELHILREVPLEDLQRHGSPALAEAVRRIRAGEVHVLGGYDGEYGVVSVFRPGEVRGAASQQP